MGKFKINEEAFNAYMYFDDNLFAQYGKLNITDEMREQAKRLFEAFPECRENRVFSKNKVFEVFGEVPGWLSELAVKKHKYYIPLALHWT
jgi:hypothetical protein